MSENDPVRPDGVSDGAPAPISRRLALVLAVVLLVIPGAVYAGTPVVSFLLLTMAQKVGLSAGLVVAAEVVFWVAAFFVGREVILRYRRFFDPHSWKR